MRFTHLFIDRPILATVLSVFLTLIGWVRWSSCRSRNIPRSCRDGAGDHSLPRRVGPGGEPDGSDAAGAGDQRRRGHDLHEQPVHRGRQAHDHRYVPHWHGPQCRADAYQNRVQDALPRLPDDVQRLGVQVRKATPNILLAVHLFSPDGSRATSISRTTRHCM